MVYGGTDFLGIFLVAFIIAGIISAIVLWIEYRILKAATKNALDESELGKYFRNQLNK